MGAKILVHKCQKQKQSSSSSSSLLPSPSAKVQVNILVVTLVFVPESTAEHPVSVSSGWLGFGDLETVEARLKGEGERKSVNIESRRVFDSKKKRRRKMRARTFHS